MQPVNVGVIGVGHLGQHHARLYAGLPQTRLVGVYDTDPVRAKTIADRHGCRIFQDPQALVGAAQAVSVAAPTTFHHALAKMCLEQGRHVLVEKPIAVTVAEAQELVDLAKARGCVLQVGHSERFNPIMLAVRDRITKPGFIEAHRLSPFGERGTDVDVVLDLMIHDLDLVLAFNTTPVEEIRAAGVAVLSPHVDIANARLQFADGCVANLTASRVSTTRLRRCRIFQHESYVSIDFQARHAMIARRMHQEGARPTLQMEQIKGSEEEPLKLQLEAFVRAIAGQELPVVSGEAGTAALALAYRIREAIISYLGRLDPMPIKTAEPSQPER